ncbi:MAG: TonB family protein [Brevundimonas sp.]|nr:MAG: TonB family protein [Brevundimonas sp.]
MPAIDPHPFAQPIASLSGAQALSHRERERIRVLFMLITILALVAALQDPQVVDGVIVRPDWVETPTGDQMTPEGVRNPTRTDYQPRGAVTLRCVVKADGRLDNCRITEISTAYPELGRTAFDAAEHFRHAPRLTDGRSAAGMPVLLKLRWGVLGE